MKEYSTISNDKVSFFVVSRINLRNYYHMDLFIQVNCDKLLNLILIKIIDMYLRYDIKLYIML